MSSWLTVIEPIQINWSTQGRFLEEYKDISKNLGAGSQWSLRKKQSPRSWEFRSKVHSLLLSREAECFLMLPAFSFPLHVCFISQTSSVWLSLTMTFCPDPQPRLTRVSKAQFQIPCWKNLIAPAYSRNTFSQASRSWVISLPAQ